MSNFKLNSAELKGRRVTYSIATPFNYDIEHVLVSSSALTAGMSYASKSTKGSKDPFAEFDRMIFALKLYMGQENLDVLLSSLEDLETAEEEAEMLGELVTILYEEVLPKLQG